MFVIDTNILIYASHEGSQRHEVTRLWLERMISTNHVLAIPWVVALGFLRITTNPRVFATPFTIDEALSALTTWLDHPATTIVEPTARHLPLLAGLLKSAGTAGNLTTDAHIATLALEHDAAVASFDRDLARFGVAVEVPS